MKFLKYINFEISCIIIISIILFFICSPNVINGNRVLGGICYTKNCLTTVQCSCGDSSLAKQDGAHCLLWRICCYGSDVDYTCTNLYPISNCNVSVYCLPGPTEQCN